MQGVACCCKLFYLACMKREQLIERVNAVLRNSTKVDFCGMAGISRPTLDKFLSGGQVIPSVETSVLLAVEKMEQQQQPAPAA